MFFLSIWTALTLESKEATICWHFVLPRSPVFLYPPSLYFSLSIDSLLKFRFENDWAWTIMFLEDSNHVTSGGFPTGAIVGVVVGLVVIIGIVAIVVVYFFRQKGGKMFRILAIIIFSFWYWSIHLSKAQGQAKYDPRTSLEHPVFQNRKCVCLHKFSLINLD